MNRYYQQANSVVCNCDITNVRVHRLLEALTSPSHVHIIIKQNGKKAKKPNMFLYL